ncbi:hypothetical protein MNBD_GAMMA09-488 [hydrothermal vent metagenome]|uniref:Uncharacterized protein n=1 Tax=hydrothermal vent metagenome TaxID=652676 RepID=A0A3B0XCE8_9ZZZZ
MPYIKANYLDTGSCCEAFVKGIELLEQSSIKASSACFKAAFESVAETHPLFSRYKSYYGFSLILSGEEAAIDLCRSAVKCQPSDGDVCMNLARAEFFLANRVNALSAVDSGLSFSAEHPGLQKLKVKIGVRRKKPLPFLSRDNPVSVALGKKMRKHA